MRRYMFALLSAVLGLVAAPGCNCGRFDVPYNELCGFACDGPPTAALRRGAAPLAGCRREGRLVERRAERQVAPLEAARRVVQRPAGRLVEARAARRAERQVAFPEEVPLGVRRLAGPPVGPSLLSTQDPRMRARSRRALRLAVRLHRRIAAWPTWGGTPAGCAPERRAVMRGTAARGAAQAGCASASGLAEAP